MLSHLVKASKPDLSATTLAHYEFLLLAIKKAQQGTTFQ